MNHQYLEYVREALFIALSDHQRSGKGQLAAFEDSPIAYTGRYKRKRLQTVQLGNRTVAAETDPLPSTETRTRKKPNPLINNDEYQFSSWRRAVGALNGVAVAWIGYCYGYNLNFDYQTAISLRVWDTFKTTLTGRRTSNKVTKRLISLVWLAVQEQAFICGREGFNPYSGRQLCEMVGVKPDNWSKHYSMHWDKLKEVVAGIDTDSLIYVARNRDKMIFREKSAHDTCKSQQYTAISAQV